MRQATMTPKETDRERAWAIAEVYYAHRPTAEDEELIRVVDDVTHYLDIAPTDLLLQAVEEFAKSGHPFAWRLFQGYVLNVTPRAREHSDYGQTVSGKGPASHRPAPTLAGQIWPVMRGGAGRVQAPGVYGSPLDLVHLPHPDSDAIQTEPSKTAGR